MTAESREFQLFVKPVGSSCNLACSYCYYLGKEKLVDGNGFGIMPEALLRNYIRQHIEATTDDTISFSWHGGEPLLAGMDFYRQVLKIQAEYNPDGKKLVNGIQTNGTLINNEWSRFFRENDFMVGISMDGPGEMHDIHRRTRQGSTSFSDVMRGFATLKENGIIPEILCVVNSANVKYPQLLYDMFLGMEVNYITFIPLVERDMSSPSGVSARTVGADEFGYFLCTVFDLWIENGIGNVKIQVFEEAARTAFGQDHTLCIFKRECGMVPVIAHNGDFYSCDHYVDAAHRLGNIKENSLSFFLDSTKQHEFGQLKYSSLPCYCLKCEVLPMCNGECPKNRFLKSRDNESGLNYLCNGYKHFFKHCTPFIQAIADVWRAQPNT